MACGTPSFVGFNNGRFVVSLDTWGKEVQNLEGVKGIYPITNDAIQGKIFTSDNRGKP